MKAYRFIVKGRVQGVWYRKTICDNSLKLGLKGYVKNLSNGDVEVAALLNENEHEEYLRILKEGSPMSDVSDIEVYECDDNFQPIFEIRY